MTAAAVRNLLKEYQLALKDFLEGGGEEALKAAYMLGRQAFEQHVSMLDVVIAHHQALTLLEYDSSFQNNRKIIKQAASFLAECLSPFEMAQRGFQDSIAALNSLNASLEEQIERRTRALRESEELYRTLIEILPDGVTVTDLEGRVNLCNLAAAHLYGYSRTEDVFGIHLDEYIAPEDLPHMQEIASNVLNDGTIGQAEYRLARKDGSRIPVEVKIALIKNAEGKPGGFIGMGRDISERKQAQLKLEASLKTEAQARQKAEHDNEMRLKALAIVSHELRTPLTSIKGFATTLLAQDVVWDDVHQRDFILTINEEANRLSDLIEQLLDLSKMEMGGFKVSPVQQHPSELVAAAMPHLETLAAYHNLSVDVPAALPEVIADSRRIGQVLENLVENAAKYSPRGTTIYLSASVSDDCVKFSIVDRGLGIPEPERRKVFKAFYRAADNATLSAKGVGLGLTICRRLIEAQGGRIWVEGHRGSGAIISFTLPVVGSVEKRVMDNAADSNRRR